MDNNNHKNSNYNNDEEKQQNTDEADYQPSNDYTEEQYDDIKNIFTNEDYHSAEDANQSETAPLYQQTQNQASNEEKPKTKRNKKSRSGLSGFFGGLAGGIIVAIIVAVLFMNNIIPVNQSAESTSTKPESTANIITTLANDEADVSTNIEEVSSAVVGVVNLQQRSVWTGDEEAGTGSGIIYKKEDGKAYVVTNQHVVDGAENVEIVLDNDERIPATVLGQDALTDLAVLEVDGANIHTVAKFGESTDIAVGETVLAIGNPLGLEFANTVTKGIISGLNRSVEVDTNSDGQPDWVTEVLQTDAAINPGNSGGALVNADGEVIGINSMKIAQSAVEGIGFAIPVDAALPIMEQLEAEGEITRPLIGISTAALYQVPPQYRYEINLPNDVEGGMVVANVEAGSPADQAGLQQFDVITKINDNEVTSILELRKYLYSDTSIGEEIKIEYIRDGKTATTKLVLEQVEDAA